MCGIVGIWNKESGAASEARVEAMLEALAHRGPDGRGTLAYEGGAAGMVRLALVDLSDRGQQPFWAPDGRVALLFNGEVYNYREERQRLARNGYRFRSTTDTEVVLALYLEHGLDFVQRLRGMYALALFDWRETTSGALPRLILARDPFGIKPLYVADRRRKPEDGLVFSSEVRALLKSGLVDRDVDPEGLADYLAHGFVVQPRTMIAGVRMLMPGTLEVYTPGRSAQTIQFWQMPARAPQPESLDEAAERLRTALEESVALHAWADAPVGAFLSGGIDSTGIVGLMRQHIPHLRTYTVRFPDVPGADEAAEAEATARAFECRHTVVDITGSEVAALLPRFAGDLDQPSADGLNTWLISRAAARDVKGVLSGLGGDEWFAGYPVTRRMARYQNTWFGRLQMLAGKAAGPLSAVAPPGSVLRERLGNLGMRRSPVATWMQAHTVFAPTDVRRMLGDDALLNDREVMLAQILAQMDATWEATSPVSVSGLLDVRVYMGSQLLRDSDATSMAHSLELRVPLVDREVAAFSRSCRDVYKLHPNGRAQDHSYNSGAKRVLVHALRDLLPDGIAKRPKRGFALPFEYWMQHGVQELVDEMCHPDVVHSRGLLDPEAVASLYRQRVDGRRGVLYPKLWTLLVLELWCRAVLDAPISMPSGGRESVNSV